ncbi:MAG: DNA-3-methyladenine glycosylase I [Ignavibacteriales bacterium]|nr:DNA-3-methyladenine glycosylase I [Ignavibacteriales bacterium]
MTKRCSWCGTDEMYIVYHDEEWGVPIHDDRHLFELLTLEGAQAGLSWLTILKKRENYKKAFHNFNIKKVAGYSVKDVQRLLMNSGIVRNRLKVESTITNAKAVLKIQKEYGSFDSYIWQFVNYKPRQNNWSTIKQLPSHTTESDAMSKDLKARGFKFIGSTICYAFMQAVGMVNDHTADCFRYKEIKKLVKKAL